MKVASIFIVMGFLLIFIITGKAIPKERKIRVPSPMEIRNFKPKSNRQMAVTYADDRVYMFQIEEIVPRSDCNQVKVDAQNRIRLMTQAISQAYEYVLNPIPAMASEWVPYNN